MPRIIPRPDLPKLTASISSQPHPLDLAFNLMLYAGLRIGEVLQICWSELIHDSTPKTALLLTAAITKHHTERTIPITHALAASISTTWHDFAEPAHFHPIDFAIAPRANTGPYTPRTLQRRLEAIGQTALGYHVNPHMLRHTFATELLAVTNIVTVQQALGHARISTTAIYTHPSIDVVSEGMARMYQT